MDPTTENPRAAIIGPRGIARLSAATRYSLAGLASAWRSEEAFRLEVWLTVVLTPAALWLGQTAIERVVLIGVLMLLMIVELLNTAVEYTVDRISTDHHHLSGGAKDLGSAAVFICLVLCGLTWGLMLADRLLN